MRRDRKKGDGERGGRREKVKGEGKREEEWIRKREREGRGAKIEKKEGEEGQTNGKGEWWGRGG